MTVLIACRLGEDGFARFLSELERLRVLSRGERLAWLALHAATMCSTLPPLDDGTGVDEEELKVLAIELGGEIAL